MTPARQRPVLMIDVDGVLITGRPKDGRPYDTDLEADLGVPMERLRAEFFTPHWEAIVTGREQMMDRLVPVLRRIAPALPPQAFIDYWFENDSRIDAEVLEEIRRQRREGRRVFLATNQEHLRARYLMETLRLGAEVDGILYSAALGNRKPGAAFFRLAAAGARTKSADIAFVDDALVNVEAARRAGWSAEQWTGNGHFAELIERVLSA
jgi:putative hydrolase of the HAD superfamily